MASSPRNVAERRERLKFLCFRDAHRAQCPPGSRRSGMKHIRRALLISVMAMSSACGGGGGGGGDGPPPAPPAPPLPSITGPASTLPTAFLNIPFAPLNFQGTGTGTLTWSADPADLPPGITLSTS